MASYQRILQTPPEELRALELWLQHAAGQILFEDVRAYALEKMASGLSEEARAAAEKGINDALYGLMMVIDGVSGALANQVQHVELNVQARLVDSQRSNVVAAIDLKDGDGICMGYHGWLEGDFGAHPVAVPKT